jgi:MinD-like ATPase involved in chromosome partitioning or flagellar assembly
MAILERSDTILLMLSPEFDSVKSAVDVIHIFNGMGFESTKVIPIVNNIFPSQRMLLNKISQVLENRTLFEIPYESSSMIQAINLGKQLTFTAPKSEISQAILQLAKKCRSSETVP